MEADMILATGTATLHGKSILGQNNRHTIDERQTLRRFAARTFAADEVLRCPSLSLPQVRQTAAILGSQTVDEWGFTNGLNEHRLAIGTASWRSRIASANGVLGSDLVRLALERCATARQARDLIADQINRHGQTTSKGQDNVFLIADPGEAFVLEAAGTYWAWTECRSVRAASNVAIIRQDWQRLAPGCAELALRQDWWPCDGSKVDFAASFTADPPNTLAQQRWRRASLLLKSESGSIDCLAARYLLSRHFEASSAPRFETVNSIRISNVLPRRAALETSSSMICDMTDTAVAWVAFGPPHLSVHVPLFVEGELPLSYSHWHPTSLWVRIQGMLAAIDADPKQERHWQRTADGLQTRIDQEYEEFVSSMRTLRQCGESTAIPRQASLFMQSHAELLENALRRPLTATSGRVLANSR